MIMIINGFRLMSLIILFMIFIIKDIHYKKLFKDQLMQLYLAIICIIIIMLVDNITGFILTIGLLFIYFRIYTSEIKNKTEEKKNTKIAKFTNEVEKCTMDHPSIKSIVEKATDCNKVPYITEENLLAAQTNIYNIDSYDMEVGVLSNEIKAGPLYNSQGLDNNNNHLRGYDINNSILGKMNYNIYE